MKRISSRWSRLAGSKLLTQFSAVLAGRLVGAGCQAVAILLLARWVSVESFGVCMALLGLLTVLQTLGDVGATTFITKEVAASGNNARVVAARRLSGWSTAAIALVGALVCSVLAIRGQRDLLLLLPLWGWLVLERATEVHAAVAMGLQRAFDVMINAAVRRIVSVAVFCVLHALGVSPLLAFASAYLVGNVLALPILRDHWMEPSDVGTKVPYRQVFAESRHYWAHSFALQARNVDAFLVGLVSGPAQAAFYGLGARLLTPLRMVPTALASAVLPHSARHGSSAMSTKKLLALVAALSLPYLALAVAWPWIVPRLFNASYSEAILPLQIMSAVLAISSCTSIISALLQGWGQGSRVSRISAVATVITLILVALGSIRGGAVGAALGFAAGACLHVVCVIHAYLKKGRSNG